MSFGDFGLESIATKKKENKPSDLEMLYYLFWRKGITLKEINELPIPYIFGILRTFTYVKNEEEKALNKK